MAGVDLPQLLGPVGGGAEIPFVAVDELPYRNNYSWFLRFEDERIVDVVAFFDSTAFNELWSRVTPGSA